MNRPLILGRPTVEALSAYRAGLAEGPLHAMLGRLIAAPQNYTGTEAVLGEFRTTLVASKRLKGQEREALCAALEDLMDLLRLDSSEGMLENFRHGIIL